MAPPRHLFSVRPEASAAAADDDLVNGAQPPCWLVKGMRTPSWVILGKIAGVPTTEVNPFPDSDVELSPGSGLLRLALAAPPRVTLLDVPPVIFPITLTAEKLPRILAAEGGLLLLQADQGLAKAHMVLVDLPGRQEFVSQDFVRDFFILDGYSGQVRILPNPQYIMEPAFLGLLGIEDQDNDFIVTELQYKEGNTATLLSLSTKVGEWVEKRVPYPLQGRLTPDAVFSHLKCLWWVDLSRCILKCDPMADEPVLSVVPLPPGKLMESRKGLDKCRWVGVSDGSLRFVEIHKNGMGADQIAVWTWNGYNWTKDHETAFSDIWDDVTSRGINLPRTVPVVALLDPIRATVVYLVQADKLYSVDLLARKVLGCDVLQVPVPYTVDLIGSNFFLSWQPGRSLCAQNQIKILMEPALANPDDLVWIFSKLSYKDLCRIKSVCKAWKALATNPEYLYMLPKPPIQRVQIEAMDQGLWA